VGSAKTGRDGKFVVDTTLKVYGTDTWRVVAASIMPHVVSGYSNAPTIMTAGKGADLILACTPPAPEHAYIEEDDEKDSAAAQGRLSE
jgi:choline dehydrogenase-like flavoprotein